MQRFFNRVGFIAVIAIFCVPVILIVLWGAYGAVALFVITHGDELYAKELDNPYVNSQFEGWNLVEIGPKSVRLPGEWNLKENNGALQISMDGSPIATGIRTVGEDVPFISEESFLSEMLEETVLKIEYDHTYSLLGSSFGMLYINEDKQLIGHYLKMADGEGFIFFCFQNEKYTQSELQSIAEAIIFSYQYP